MSKWYASKDDLVFILNKSFDEELCYNDYDLKTKLFLKLKQCKFNILNDFESVCGYKTSFLIYSDLRNAFVIDKNTVIGFICTVCDRKISTKFYMGLNDLRVLRAENLECGCDECLIKDIIE